ncbi:hypothetical protein GQ53DRAFT_25359 [Thozetella sp. PMI_491]|nr:hypothetical protein GQ53DRAFT_25359 [Thozetella sp. PMI_491]
MGAPVQAWWHMAGPNQDRPMGGVVNTKTGRSIHHRPFTQECMQGGQVSPPMEPSAFNQLSGSWGCLHMYPDNKVGRLKWGSRVPQPSDPCRWAKARRGHGGRASLVGRRQYDLPSLFDVAGGAGRSNHHTTSSVPWKGGSRRTQDSTPPPPPQAMQNAKSGKASIWTEIFWLAERE